MSIVVSETSPRALLESAMNLSYTLNLMGEEDIKTSTSAGHRGPGFVLHEVENVLVQVRADLDCPYVIEHKNDQGGDTVPLMMRLRGHINAVSSVLTGNSVRFATADRTTLLELIDSMSALNASVCCTSEKVNCTIQ